MTASNPKTGSEHRDKIIDLAWAGTAADGTRVYATPPEAFPFQLGRGLGWLALNYPQETLHTIALASTAGACLYFAHEASQDDLPRKRSRRRR